MGRLDPENTVQAAELSPEDYRRRYFALKETGQKRGSAVLRWSKTNRNQVAGHNVSLCASDTRAT